MAAESIVRSKQAAEAIGGILTEVVCTIFSDHIFVVVTQYGKIGTLISVTPHIVANEVGKPTFSTKILMGKDEHNQSGDLQEVFEITKGHAQQRLIRGTANAK